MQLPKELLKGVTDYLLLSLVGRLPMHGYQMAREINQRSKGYLKLDGGTLYPALRRLEKQGLIVSWWERVSERQKRRYYRITETGRQALKIKLAEWQDFCTAMNMLLAEEE